MTTKRMDAQEAINEAAAMADAAETMLKRMNVDYPYVNALIALAQTWTAIAAQLS